jgi:hypothetical protein
MEDIEPVRKEIVSLLSQNYGEKFAGYFEKTYGHEIFPIFTHNCFVVLKDLVGIEKAREELNRVLVKYNVGVSYE